MTATETPARLDPDHFDQRTSRMYTRLIVVGFGSTTGWRLAGVRMEFEWDERKRSTTLAERKVDILYAAGIFEGFVLSRVDDRRDYGETCLVSVGMVGDECFVVVHTVRDGVTRLITAWKGGRDERSSYEESLARGAHADEAGG